MKKPDKNRLGWSAKRFSLLPLNVCSLLYYFEHGFLMQKCCQSFPKPYLRDSHNSKASRLLVLFKQTVQLGCGCFSYHYHSAWKLKL